MCPKWTERNQNWLSVPNWIEVDLIGPNSNCLIVKENKLYIILQLQLQLQNNYLFPRIAWVYE